MVGMINPADGQSIDTQKSAAINADYQLVPGQSWPAEGSSSKSQSTSSSVPSTKSKDEKKLSGGAICGHNHRHAAASSIGHCWFGLRLKASQIEENPEELGG
jgi:hypothetical protein